MPRKIISAAVCAAMLLSLLALSPRAAEASAPAATDINVDGIGKVTYVQVDTSAIHDEDGEWYHATIDGKDYRKLASRTDVVYYAENYPALPDRNAQNNPVEKSGGLGFKLYGVSKMTFYEFWKNEGLTAGTVTDISSDNPDPEGYNDLGGFDAVSRSTLSYGIGHTAYAFETTIYGYDQAKYDVGDLVPTGPFTPVFRAKSMGANGAVGSASASYGAIGFPTYRKGDDTTQSPSGHASAEIFFVNEGAGESEHVIDHYDVTGPANVPVSVDAADYVENMILDDMGQSVPSAFKNIRVGEKLPNIVDESDATGATMQDIEVGADTGLLKHINKNGEYGKAAPGKNEMSYKLTSNGFLDAEGKPTYGTGYNTSWGDYFDVYIYFQPEGSVKTTSDVNGQQYFNYINNFIGAKYEYYGDVSDIAGVDKPSDITGIADLESKSSVKAAYGTNFAADSWTAPSKKPRLELGFNFDAIRLGGDGTDTSAQGIYQYGSSRNKTGFYKITLYTLGHENIEKLVYVPNQAPLTLSSASINLVKGQSQTLVPSYADPAGKITRIDWGSSNDNVATVDENGQVTAVAAGNATITAEAINEATGSNGTVTESTVYAAECGVTVTNPSSDKPTTQQPKASIKLNVSAATLYHKGSKSKTTLTATVTGADKNVVWTSSNTKVATVNGSGVVTAKSKGTATITATANGVKATATITVKNATLTLKKQSAAIKKGKKAAIKATATPKAKITYKSSNKKVATVTSSGVVKGKKKGKATITVTANGITKKFRVTVK